VLLIGEVAAGGEFSRRRSRLEENVILRIFAWIPVVVARPARSTDLKFPAVVLHRNSSHQSVIHFDTRTLVTGISLRRNALGTYEPQENVAP